MIRRTLLSSCVILAFAAVANAGVLLSEIDYDQAGTDNNEWIELYNPDPAPQPLTGIDLVLVNGSGCTAYGVYGLDAIVIPANGYVVVGNIACADPSVVLPASNAIQNGAPDDVFLIDRATGATIDAVEYENAGPSVCGAPPTDATDSNVDLTGSIQRCGNGWIYDLNYTPCAANNCPPISVDETTWGRVKGSYR